MLGKDDFEVVLKHEILEDLRNGLNICDLPVLMSYDSNAT